VNVANFLSIPASLFPDQEILVCDDVRQTYGQSVERVRKLATALHRLGCGVGDRIAVLQTNCHRYVEAFYATATIGGVFVPLNYRAQLAELEHMLSAGGVKALLFGERYRDRVESLRPRLPSIQSYVMLERSAGGFVAYEDLIAGAPPAEQEAVVDDDDTAILMYTSGTTALPKGVMLSHTDFTAYVCGTVEMADGAPRGSALLCAPIYHIAGAANMMTTVFGGRRLVIMSQFEPRKWLDAVEREGVTHAFVVPTMLKQLLDQPDLASRDLSSLETLAYGGAAMPLSVVRRAIETFPENVGFVNAFGQTETTSTLTILGPEDHRLSGSPEEVERKLKRLQSIGRPLPDVELKVVDEEGREVPRGQVGEIFVRTPRVMKGYATAGGSTSELRDGWLPTRDMGWIDQDGYVFLGGRRDDMIIRGGENIAPAEVEAVIQTHPAVDEVAVIGVPDLEWGQRVVAVLTLRPGMELTPAAMVEYCRQRLASFKKPEEVHIVTELPKNHLGKVLRRELRVQFADRGAAK
jgi:acyl-CoA synthetase (AMP-forming)/AMP-acid ligase II